MLLAHAHDSPARKFSTLRGSSTVGQLFWVARKPTGCSTPCSASARRRRKGSFGHAVPHGEADYGEWASYPHGCL